MHVPHITMTLLVEVHSHYQWLAELLCQLYKTLPRWMMAKYVTNYQFLPSFLCSLSHALCTLYRVSQRLFNKYMAPSLQCFYCKALMCIRICGNTNSIGFCTLQCLFKIVEQRITTSKLLVQHFFAFTG